MKTPGPNRVLSSALLFVSLASLVFFFAPPSHGGSSTWSVNPTNNDWNTADNWVPADVPNGTYDTASFATSNITQISTSETVQLHSLTFEPGASAYTLTRALVFSGFYGAGVINDSGVTQNIVASESLTFTDSSTAGSEVVYSQHGTTFNYGIGFYDGGNAESATFIVIGDDPDSVVAF